MLILYITIFFITVVDYNLVGELDQLMRYFERFWMDLVIPQIFTVFRLQYRTNNFVESYHASLLRLIGQHPTLYRFYGNFLLDKIVVIRKFRSLNKYMSDFVHIF